MSLVLSDTGAEVLLAAVFDNTSATLRLYTNNRTPSDTDVSGDYTEAAGGGYAAKALTAGNWTVTSSNPPAAVYAEQAFTFTGALAGPGTIYGYFVEDGLGRLLWAERFLSPFTPTQNGDQLKITPRFEMSKGVPS
jgi:hypothetical protein